MLKTHFKKASRARLLAILTVCAMAVFEVRLFYIQIVQHDYYVAQANSEQLKQFVLHASRGQIYAMDGGNVVPLVMNETVYTVWADPTQVTDSQAIITNLNQIAGGNTRPNLSGLLAQTKTRYQVLATKVTRSQAEMLKAKNLAGLGFDAVSRRVYPEAQTASQILGFVDANGKGQYGFEQYENQNLTGKDGLLKTVTDVRNIPLTIGKDNVNIPAREGTNYALTIDRNIQAKTEQALAAGLKQSGATNGSAIIIDPQTGKVLSMANFPTFNPTKLATITDLSTLNNGTITVPYEPGSDIKTFTVSTGIDKGVITPKSTYNNTGQIKVEDITINNASKNAIITGNIDMQTALSWSLNTGMVTIAERLGDGKNITQQARDTMYNYLHNRFRLGQPTGIELAGEAGGTIVPPTDVQGNAVRYSNMAFGQGMDVTMLQVVAGFSAIVDGGVYHDPSIINGTVDGNGNLTPAEPKPSHPGVISPQTAATVTRMVYNARQEFYAGNDIPGYNIGGKTGTSQTLENGKYVDNQTIGTYLGFGGEKGKTPRYVIMVQVSGKNMNLEGGRDAMPIFTDVSNWMIGYLKLEPKG